MGLLESEGVYMSKETIFRLVDYLLSIRVSNDKYVRYYCGAASDNNPALEVRDEYTDEIMLWWGELTRDRFRAMCSEVRTDFRK